MKKFEFILYINGNIICQRYFSVKNYNKKVINSLDIYECVTDCVDIIEKDLRTKTEDYLYKHYNPYQEQKQEDIQVVDIYEEEDVFDFEIRVDERSIAKKRFSGNKYPQRVRYSVDIRRIIPTLIKEIQNTLSRENLDVEYCGIEL